LRAWPRAIGARLVVTRRVDFAPAPCSGSADRVIAISGAVRAIDGGGCRPIALRSCIPDRGESAASHTDPPASGYPRARRSPSTGALVAHKDRDVAEAATSQPRPPDLHWPIAGEGRSAQLEDQFASLVWPTGSTC
jgi:hypothetical protein